MAKTHPLHAHRSGRFKKDSTQAKSGSASAGQGLFWRSPKEKDLIKFTRGMAVMLSAKLNLADALKASIKTATNKKLADVLSDLSKAVNKGLSLSAAMQEHPKIFGNLYVNMIRTGESAGIVDQVMSRLADHLEKSADLKRKVKAALSYPTMVLFVASLAVFFFLTSIVPTFSEMFASFDAELPGPTLFIVGISDFLLTKGWVLLLLCVAVIVGGAGALRTEKGRWFWDGFKLKIPLIGRLQTRAFLVHFCSTLGQLLGNGVNLLESMKILSENSSNVVIRKALSDAMAQVRRGSGLSKPLEKSGIFPALVHQMVSVGEETSRLDQVMTHLGKQYESEMDSFIDGLTSVIEPVLIMVVGVIIGGILIALYLPLFELIHVVG